MTVATPPKSTDETVADIKPGKAKNALLSSMFIWIVVLFIATGEAIRPYYKLVDTGFAEKLSSFYQSDRHPDALLLGSSVAFPSSFDCDASIGVLTDKDLKSNYHGAVQLQKSIEASTGKKFTLENLACFGAMTNQAWLETEKLVEFQKAPKVIIYEMVSRDLFDASMPRSFESEYYRVLSFLHPKSSGNSNPFQSIGDSIGNSHVVTLIRNLISDPETLKNSDRLRFEFDSALGAMVCVYQHRFEILGQLSNSVADLFSRQSAMEGALSKVEIENKRKNPFAKVSAQRVETYVVDSSPQLGRFEDEKVYFLKFLQLCKQHKIQLIVVNMPVTEEYDKLVPTEIKARWPKEAKEAVESAGFAFIDFDDKKIFPKSCFVDMAHLNLTGALKVNALLSREIAKRNLLKDM